MTMNNLQAHFIVYGEPFGKKSVQAYISGGRVSTYAPKENKNYQASIKMAYIDTNKDIYFGDKTQLKVVIKAYRSIPKATSKKRHALMLDKQIKPITKPDTDNISKAICDGLNKLAFRDDSQITTLIVKKYYDTIPRVEVFIEIDKGE